jgi:hypothetical protein
VPWPHLWTVTLISHNSVFGTTGSPEALIQRRSSRADDAVSSHPNPWVGLPPAQVLPQLVILNVNALWALGQLFSLPQALLISERARARAAQARAPTAGPSVRAGLPRDLRVGLARGLDSLMVDVCRERLVVLACPVGVVQIGYPQPTRMYLDAISVLNFLSARRCVDKAPRVVACSFLSMLKTHMGHMGCLARARENNSSSSRFVERTNPPN